MGMKNQSTPSAKAHLQSAFFNLRVLIGLFIVLAGVFLALVGFGVFSPVSTAQAQQEYHPAQSGKAVDPLVPPMFDCSKIHELGIDKQMNFRAGAIMIYCGEAQGGTATSGDAAFRQVEKLLSPLTYGATDVDLITGIDTYPHVTQSTTFTAINPDNPQQIVIAYNDSRGRNANPINISGASVSTDGGTTFDRLTLASGQSPFSNTVGDPVVLYKRNNSTWYTVWIDLACGGPGIGGYKSTTPWDPNSWTHYCVHTGTNDDSPSGWVDNNSASPHYGRMYVSWNDYARGAAIFVRYSDDGVTWTETGPLPGTGNVAIQNVQITGDLATGDVYNAVMNENGGGNFNRNNLIYRSTDGGTTFTNTYTSPTFFGPGRAINGFFACMYSSPAPGYWRHTGSGQPAAFNHVVHYVYAQCGQNVPCSSATDHGNIYYIRSTDSGVTFAAPVKLNTDAGTAAQWEPSLSVSPSGTLFAVWYDERNGGNCTAGSNTPCYQMFARKSNDNGVTWMPDMAFSDVVSPLPAQPDPGIVGSYVDDYDYQIAVAASHRTAWVDGRVAINNVQQQDAFTDRELVGPQAQDALSRKVHGAAGTFDIPLPLTGSVGVECRSGGSTHDFQMIVDFPGAVTVQDAQVTSGAGMVSSFSGSGTTQITVNLTGVTDAQRITMTLINVNDGTHTGNVPVSMGVLVGDVNGNAVVNATDVALTKSQVGMPVGSSNFREDVNANGAISSTDVAIVKSDVGTSLPP